MTYESIHVLVFSVLAAVLATSPITFTDVTRFAGAAVITCALVIAGDALARRRGR